MNLGLEVEGGYRHIINIAWLHCPQTNQGKEGLTAIRAHLGKQRRGLKELPQVSSIGSFHQVETI